MALPATDNFNRADGDVGANWTTNWQSNASAYLIVSTNRCNQNGAGVGCGEYWNADSFANDQYSQFVYLTISDAGLTCRNTGGDAYIYYVEGGFSALYQYNSNSWDEIASTSGGASNGDTVRIEAEGTTIRGLVNGSSTGQPSGTDSSLGSGSAGIYMAGQGGFADDWQGGNLAAGPTQYQRTNTGALTSAGATARKLRAKRTLTGAI